MTAVFRKQIDVASGSGGEQPLLSVYRTSNTPSNVSDTAKVAKSVLMVSQHTTIDSSEKSHSAVILEEKAPYVEVRGEASPTHSVQHQMHPPPPSMDPDIAGEADDTYEEAGGSSDASISAIELGKASASAKEHRYRKRSHIAAQACENCRKYVQ